MPVLFTNRVKLRSSGHRHLSLSSRVKNSAVGGPQAHDNPHWSATGGAEGDARFRRYETSWLASDGVCLRDHQADGVGRDRTAGMEKAEVTDLDKAIGQDMLEESAEQLHGVELGSAWAGTAELTGGEGDGAVLERDDAAVGDGDLEDRGGEGGEGRVAVGVGLAVDVPVGMPDQWVDLLQQSSLVHIFFEESAVNG